MALGKHPIAGANNEHLTVSLRSCLREENYPEERMFYALGQGLLREGGYSPLPIPKSTLTWLLLQHTQNAHEIP